MFSSRKLILLIITLTTICIAAYVLLVYIPSAMARKSYEGAKEIGRDIRELFRFTPEVKVNNTVVLEQQSPILELATLSQTFKHTHVWQHTLLKSTKTITIKGTMNAKAGFDLNRKFIIDIHEDKAVVTVPHPRLLSIEQGDDISFEDENGIWNWVSDLDRSKAINAFNNSAREYAAKADFLKAAEKNFLDKLTAILQAHGKTVDVRYDEIPALPENQDIVPPK